MGRSLSRGDKPTELSYSWLPEKWIEVQPPRFFPQLSANPTRLKETLRELVTGGTAPVTQDTTLTGGLRSHLTKVLCLGGPKSSHPDRKR